MKTPQKMAIIIFIFLFLPMQVMAQEVEIEVNVPESYHDVMAGENLWFTTKVTGAEDGEYMEIKYEIIDSNEMIKVSKFDFVKIGTHESFTGNINIPIELEEGTYYLKVSAKGSSENTPVKVIKNPGQDENIIENSLFDIVVDIPQGYREVEPGEELLSSIKLINLGSAGRVDVFLDYWIVNSKEDIVLKKTETVAVETQANFVRSFDIPDDLPSGDYKLYAKITYADGRFADGEHSFKIVESGIDVDTEIYYAAISILSLAIVIILLIKSKPLIEKMKIRAKVAKIVKKRREKK